MEQTTEQQVARAQRYGVPLIGLETTDQLAFCRTLTQAVAGKDVGLVWQDCVTGINGLNERGQEIVNMMCMARVPGGQNDISDEDINEAKESWTGAPEVAALDFLKAILLDTSIKNCLLLMGNSHAWIGEAGTEQALCLLRESAKMRSVTIILCGPSLSLPPAVAQDILMIDSPLPSLLELRKIVSNVVDDAKAGAPQLEVSAETIEQAANGLRSLSAFAAEQATALALTQAGLDVAEVQRRRKKQLEQAKGVQVIEPSERFTDLAGLDQGKAFLQNLINGPSSPVAVAFVDELDKAMEGSTGGDLSGVSAGFLGALLSYMQDYEVMGVLLYGIPGAGKTALARAFAGEYCMPFVSLDLGAMRGGLVGESEANVRAALKVTSAISEPRRLLLIATCNRVNSLPPELEARFGLGSFFFDYPQPVAQEQAFNIWLDNFGIDKTKAGELPEHDKWVGREIRQCCELAWRFNSDLKTASQYIVPGYTKNKKQLQTLRQAAHGKFLNVDRPGVFMCEEGEKEEKSEGRSMQLDTGAGGAIALVAPGSFFPGIENEDEKKPSRKIGFGE